jgi:acyl carrier protein phosphodiesterase
MNYLAHLLLADDSDASRIGNLLGDFTTGSLEQLARQFPPEIVRGIRMHRAVDRFTDSHRVFKQARELLAPARRRFAGIIVDIIFDHYLSRHWHDYCDQPLEAFIRQVYRALDAHPEWRAGRLSRVYPMMKHENWLMTYSSLEGISLTLRRVSTRSPRVGKIAGGAEDLQENYTAFESCFRDFMPHLLEFAAQWKEKH